MKVVLEKQAAKYLERLNEPIFDVLIDDETIIETDLTDEELAIIAEGDRHYKEHPEDFISLDDIK